jgi:BlaI family transcriptional regulator, penicillinase repressor
MSLAREQLLDGSCPTLNMVKITKHEWQIMQVLWERGPLSINEIKDGVSRKDCGPAYSTVQTLVYRLEAKGAVRRVEKVRNFHIFEASVRRERAERELVADLLPLFKERGWAILEHAIALRGLTLDDVKSAVRYFDILAQPKP